MNWFKTLSDFPNHPKIRGLTDQQFRVLVTSWAYSSQYGTGGKISLEDVKFLGGNLKVAEALTKRGLWEANCTGWVIHDWDDHQAEANAWEERRARDRDRKRTSRPEAAQ